MIPLFATQYRDRFLGAISHDESPTSYKQEVWEDQSAAYIGLKGAFQIRDLGR
jgi:hypothetical protein